MLRLGAAGRWLSRRALPARIATPAAATGSTSIRMRVVQDLPLGMRQRVEILKALMRDVDLLVLDEPTSILAPREVEGLSACCASSRPTAARSSSSRTSCTKSSRSATTSWCCATARSRAARRSRARHARGLAHMMVGRDAGRAAAARRPRLRRRALVATRLERGGFLRPAAPEGRELRACAAARSSRSPASTATASPNCATSWQVSRARSPERSRSTAGRDGLDVERSA